MNSIRFREAGPEDTGRILEIQEIVFHGEQHIPSDLLDIPEEKQPRWFVAEEAGQVIGTCAAWKEGDDTHFGRFALDPDKRGHHIGTELLKYAYDRLFADGEEVLVMECRDVSVHVISRMGGEITGEPFDLFGDPVTPMILRKENYHK